MSDSGLEDYGQGNKTRISPLCHRYIVPASFTPTPSNQQWWLVVIPNEDNVLFYIFALLKETTPQDLSHTLFCPSTQPRRCVNQCAHLHLSLQERSKWYKIFVTIDWMPYTQTRFLSFPSKFPLMYQHIRTCTKRSTPTGNNKNKQTQITTK